MKKTYRTMQIVVVASRPEDGQDGIERLIGQEFEAEVDEKGQALVNSPEFGGQISLSPSEWREKGEGEPS